MKINSPVQLFIENGEAARPGVGSSNPEFCLPLPHEACQRERRRPNWGQNR